MDSWPVLFACLVGTLQLFHGASGAGTWGYFGADDPSHWASVDSKCSGEDQSPIDLKTTKYEEIPTFTLTGFDSTNALSLALINNGHTAKLSISGNVKVNGGDLPAEYTVAQLHYHWGKTDSLGSEHLVNGKAFPMEMHIVTYKSEYGSLGDSLSRPDGLAVLGFFFEIGEETHAGHQKIIDVIPNILNKDTNHTVATFKLRELLPSSFPTFYRYSGSLTTPTCNEVVTWTVFTNTIKVTAAQMAVFRTLQAGEHNDENTYNMYNNFRPPQALNGRVVKANFIPSSSFRPSIHFSLMILPVLSFVLKQFI